MRNKLNGLSSFAIKAQKILQETADELNLSSGNIRNIHEYELRGAQEFLSSLGVNCSCIERAKKKVCKCRVVKKKHRKRKAKKIYE